MLPEQATPLLLSPDDQRAQAEGKEVTSSKRQVTLPEQATPLVLSPDDQRAQAKGKEVMSSERQVTLPELATSLLLPRGDQSAQAKERAREAKSKQRQENLSASALANARQAMSKADATRFICAPRAWCAMRSATGLLIVVVEDGRYAGAACDQAGLVIAPRARFSSCRSGTPLMNGSTLRKTGALTIDFSGTPDPRHWQATTAATNTSRPWSMHRRYDWRRDVYDASLPSWLNATPPTEDLAAPPDDLPPTSEEDGSATFLSDAGE